MRKALPEKMFSDSEQSRLVTLRSWVLDNQVTEIEMSEAAVLEFRDCSSRLPKSRGCRSWAVASGAQHALRVLSGTWVSTTLASLASI